jgi:hypothetical protein
MRRNAYQPLQQPQVVDFKNHTAQLGSLHLEFGWKSVKLDLHLRRENGRLLLYFSTANQAVRKCTVQVTLIGVEPEKADPTKSDPVAHGIVSQIGSFTEDRRLCGELKFGSITQLERRLGPAASIVVTLLAKE